MSTQERRSKSGVLLSGSFRENLIIDRYDVGFLTMRGAKTESMRSENSEDAVTWNAFRSLAQITPAFWLPRLFQHAFQKTLTPAPQSAGVRLWVKLPPPPTLRFLQKDEGDFRDRRADRDRTLRVVYRGQVSFRYQRTHHQQSGSGPNLRNVDVGSWYAGVRQFYLSLLILDRRHSAKGVALIDRYSLSPHEVEQRLPHRSDGLRNVHGLGILTWQQVGGVLAGCATSAPNPDERVFAERAVAWFHRKQIGAQPAEAG